MTTRLRRLHIDGHQFRWRAEIGQVKGSEEWHRVIRFRAWGAGKTSRPLDADLLSTQWSEKYRTMGDGSYPTAADARTLIEYALANGWQPTSRGGPFVLSERERIAVPGFLLTDRLRSPDEGEDPTARVRDSVA